jgi:hypothetical protein
MKQKQEFSASTVAFISHTIGLRVKLAGATRQVSVEKGIRGGGEGERGDGGVSFSRYLY